MRVLLLVVLALSIGAFATPAAVAQPDTGIPDVCEIWWSAPGCWDPSNGCPPPPMYCMPP